MTFISETDFTRVFIHVSTQTFYGAETKSFFFEKKDLLWLQIGKLFVQETSPYRVYAY